MATPRQKDVLTTGEVAKICNVAPRTVSKWFDSGQLRGYRIPGSKDRRIPLAALQRFMKQHNIPMDALQSGQTRVLVVDADTEATRTLCHILREQANYDVHTVSTGFAAGAACEKFKPHVIFLEMHLEDIDADDMRQNVRENPDLEMTRIVALSGRLTDGQAHQLLTRGIDGFLKKPFDARQAIQAIEDAASIVH
ncbi:MAG: response regulator [Phycisphaeraceae bacterium]